MVVQPLASSLLYKTFLGVFVIAYVATWVFAISFVYMMVK